MPQRNCPAVDGQGHVFACVKNTLVSLSLQEGGYEVLWEYDSGGHIPGSPSLGSDGHVRVHSGDGYLHVVRASGKRFCDPVKVGEPLGWATPLVDQHNVTWICSQQGGLYRVDADGKKVNRPYLRSREKFDSTGLIHNDVLYVGGNNACVYAIPLNESRGRNRWNPLEGQGKTGWYINAALALAKGPALIVASRDDQLYAFGLNGETIWNEPMPGQMLGSPVVDAGNGVYVGLAMTRRGEDGGGMLIRIDLTTHKILWRFETDAPVESTPVIGEDGVIYFGDNDGVIHAVDQDGRPQWSERLAAPVRSAGTIVSPKRLAFGMDNGQLAILNCDSERIMPGGWPKYMGLLEQSERADAPH